MLSNGGQIGLHVKSTHRPLVLTPLGAAHIHRQLQHHLVEGLPSFLRPSELVHGLSEREVAVSLRTLDDKWPSPEMGTGTQLT